MLRFRVAAGIVRLLCWFCLGASCGGCSAGVRHSRLLVCLGQLGAGILTPGSKRAWNFGRPVSFPVGGLMEEVVLPRMGGQDS